MATNQLPINPAPSFPLFGILGCIFIVLKLCGTIDWSWWWVLAPFWGVAALIVAIFAAAVVLPSLFMGLAVGWAGLALFWTYLRGKWRS
jgi:hypothetical protein